MRKARILLVDDERGIRYILRKMLEGAGYEVVEASSGEDCLDILDKEKLDLVLLDVMMPGLNGWEVCTRIKSRKETVNIPVGMLTVRNSKEDKLKSFEKCGADWHISKPIDHESLLEAVKWLLERQSERDV